jgi:hypothetical protein
MQPGCVMKIFEAERRSESANPHRDTLLQQQQEEGNTGAAHLGARKAERRDGCEECEGIEREMCPWAISKYFGD